MSRKQTNNTCLPKMSINHVSHMLYKHEVLLFFGIKKYNYSLLQYINIFKNYLRLFIINIKHQLSAILYKSKVGISKISYQWKHDYDSYINDCSKI